MIIKNAPDVPSSEITPQRVYLRRREFLSSAGVALAALATGSFGGQTAIAAGAKLSVVKRTLTTSDPPTPYSSVTTYNNFYEFGSQKSDPAALSNSFKPKPWSIAVEGACGKPGVYTLEDILKPHPLEERVYRHRCVEGWSIVVPWDGFPLSDLLRRFEPTGNAKFVEFTTILRPQEMVGQRRFAQALPWPYREGLRIDEAMHPLALVAIGLYGEELPNQNGAPLRLVIPWKYGFKSIKSVVKIRFLDTQPTTTWQVAAPEYYAFYSNVNPARTNSIYRDQATERRLGEFFMRKTLMFNGYGDQVASLYADMNLQKYF
jgi:sulfoxide reductase catalytic subunit YedY